MDNSSWFNRLRAGLAKTTDKISDGINQIFNKSKLDKSSLIQLEDLLIEADLGVQTAEFIVGQLAKDKYDKEISSLAIKQELAKVIQEIIQDYATPIVVNNNNKVQVILVCGVNGNGKTTTIGKLANYYLKQNKKVMLAACDTFRAGATEQLDQWAKKLNCPIIKAATDNSDPASVAYCALSKATEDNIDLLLIDTAGRLHNKTNLMEELMKIIRVLKKIDPQAPDNVLLVLDATTGQNAYNQLEVFTKLVNVSGLIITKLDGSAKAGVIIGLAKKYQLPIHAIGVGEGVDDLRDFNPEIFAKNIVGIS